MCRILVALYDKSDPSTSKLFVTIMSRLFFQQLPIIMALTIAAPAACDKMSSNQLPSNNPSYHKFLDTAFKMLPNSNSNADDALLNRLQKLADTYPTYVTLTTAQKLFNVDGQQQSYALIIQDKQTTQNIPDFKRTVISPTQLELVESSSNIRDVVNWFYHFIQNDDASVSGVTSTKEETAQEEEEVSSTTTARRDIILSAAIIGRDELIRLAEMMLQAADCESTNANHDVNSTNFISDGRLRCRNEFREVGIDSKFVEWLADVVFTRRTIILPSAAIQDSSAPYHGRLNLLWVVVACVSLLLTVTIMTVSRLKRKRRSRIWLEVEANRRIVEDIMTEPFQADFTRELTSFDEELTVQLIEPSRSVVLV